MNKFSLIVALVIAAALLAGCGTAAKNDAPASPEPEAQTPETLVGGWSVPESCQLTDDQRSAFEKVTEGLLGAEYEPVACLGTQVVAGTNYALLCTEKVVAPDAVPGFSVAYIYADLQGGA